jgi:hypothetical protein
MFNELMIVKVFKSRIFRITNWTMSSLINVLLNISMVRSFFFKLYSFNIHSLKVGHGDWLIPDDAPLTISNLISLLTCSIHITELIEYTLKMHLINAKFSPILASEIHSTFLLVYNH